MAEHREPQEQEHPTPEQVLRMACSTRVDIDALLDLSEADPRSLVTGEGQVRLVRALRSWGDLVVADAANLLRAEVQHAERKAVQARHRVEVLGAAVAGGVLGGALVAVAAALLATP